MAHATRIISLFAAIAFALPCSGGTLEGTWKRVNSLRLKTGTIKVGMWTFDFNRSTGREPLGKVKPSKFKNYKYDDRFSSEPFIVYDTWSYYVVDKIDFRVRWKRYLGRRSAANAERVESIEIWTGEPHPNPSGNLNGPY